MTLIVSTTISATESSAGQPVRQIIANFEMTESPRTSWLAVMAATLVGFGMLFAPDVPIHHVESFVHDAALPGLRALNYSYRLVEEIPEELRLLSAVVEAEADFGHGHGADERMAVRLKSLQQESRQLQSQIAQLQSELEQVRTRTRVPFVGESAAPLFVPELLNARIVAADDVAVAVQRASAQRIVDVGQTDGVIPADFVVSTDQSRLEDSGLLIDQGNEVGLRPDQPVFAGRCVLGKVQQVGRWTSSVLPITDSQYRGSAQLMRRTPQGLVVGPAGIIAGDGEAGCELNFIAATEPVSVGDEVYTAISATTLPMPMYYGRVTSAEVADGAPYWRIHVDAAESMGNSPDVQVLRVVLNPTRTASNLTGEVMP